MKSNFKSIRCILLVFIALLFASCSKNPSGQTSLVVFPNPSYGIITLMGENMQHFTLLDAAGQIVKEGDVTCNSFSIDVSDLPQGNYLLQVVTVDEIVVESVSITGFNVWESPYYQ